MAEENTPEGQPVPKTGLLTFFLDHQFGRYTVAKMLRAAGHHRVEVHLDHFPGNTPDHEWIPEVGRRGWVLITKDQHIHRNPLERVAYAAAKLRGFVVTGKDSASFFMSRPAHPHPADEREHRQRSLAAARAKEEMTGHGFRSMASTLLNEQGWHRDAIERQLAHGERDAVRAAYNYAEHLPERRRMMQASAD